MSRGIYTAEHAAMLLKKAGEKWRPSNGFEGELFQDQYCAHCNAWSAEAGCPIANAAFFYDKDDQGYPADWKIGADGQPTCSAFKDPNGPDERQVDLFAQSSEGIAANGN